MKQYNLLIVDDEAPAREKLKRFLNNTIGYKFNVDESISAVEAFEILRKKSIDLLLLDIQMPQLSGVELIGQLKENGWSIPVTIFTTAYDQYAIQAFELHAVDYLLKPFDQSRFQAAINHALHQLESKVDPVEKLIPFLESNDREKNNYKKQIWVSKGHSKVPLETKEIIYFKAAGNYVEVKTKLSKYLMRNTIADFESSLDPQSFSRINRSCIVNIFMIKSVSPKSHGDMYIELKNGEQLVLSRHYKQHLF